ncbi:hypothetical protein ORI20_30435 [Mycobacterium sp. CVI_P3]|uniref:Uncharacterized protein n=1 Tax=Mycobacterium pinniadriaticum TaxID=2994102 RepID=A0ABT3SPA6_9MYCO|nr:hypothetical protein [Mycobacterium pinniadriaticum]MCX2934590.1 hypothetical protein [Mycobacterium pinniadriaticum]MCX2941008.1 hypothetical protein [Mycobacterium pinniadriaticum]
MDDDDFQPKAYPPSILIGGAGLVVVLTGIVVSVLMVSAASVDHEHTSPRARTPHPASTSAATATAVAGEPSPQNGLEGFIARLTPQLPALDRLVQAP